MTPINLDYRIDNYEDAFDTPEVPFPKEFPGLKLPRGMLSVKELRILTKYSENGVCLELGTFKGKGTTMLSQRAKKVYTIDAYFEECSLKCAEYTFEALKKRFEGTNVDVIKGYTATVDIHDEFDLVFIDAGHSYGQVAADFEKWFPQVKPGGVIIFHDYYYLYPGIIKFVHETLDSGRVEKLELSDSCFVVRKL